MKITGTREQIDTLLKLVPPTEFDDFFGGNIEYEYTDEPNEDLYSLANKRDNIIFETDFEELEYPDGYRHFDGLSLGRLKNLYDEGFINPTSYVGESPTEQEFYKFMKRHPLFTAHGVVYSPETGSVRTLIEGVSYCGHPTMEMVVDFTALAHDADEFVVSLKGMNCWYKGATDE